MKVHILGVAGTFMAGVAALARELGHEVEGSDQAVYPPMSTQLERLGIRLAAGYRPEHIAPDCDQVIVGNALSRGNPAVEAVLDDGRAYISGAQWLAEQVLPGRCTLAVAGTHGKTTTSSLLAFLLEAAGAAPGFLIGGVAEDFGVSARLGGAPDEDAPPRPAPLFVVEADEYDTAFFDKRSKFVHYRPRIAVLNNLEYDHADIFPDLASIQRQFHHFVRTIPGNGRLIVNGEDPRLAEVLAMGCWTPVERFGIDERAEAASASDAGANAAGVDGSEVDGSGNGASAAGNGFDWTARLLRPDGSAFAVHHRGARVGTVEWPLLGRHNVMNALAAIAAAHAAGVDVAAALPALARFRGVKRRLEVLGAARGVTVYDDFAHHPTAIRTTLDGLRVRVGTARIVVAMEPRSNSMRLGAHADALAPALAPADLVVFLHRPELAWDAARVTAAVRGDARTTADAEALVEALVALARPGDHVVFMSNGGFDGAQRAFLARLQAG